MENVQKLISIENVASGQLKNSATVIKILRSASFEIYYHGANEFLPKHCANVVGGNDLQLLSGDHIAQARLLARGNWNSIT
jgi:hypothetical protein